MLVIMLIMQIMQIWSFVRLLPRRTCRGLATVAQQYNSAGGRERLQRCCTTLMFPPPEKLHRREIYASGGGWGLTRGTQRKPWLTVDSLTL